MNFPRRSCEVSYQLVRQRGKPVRDRTRADETIRRKKFQRSFSEKLKHDAEAAAGQNDFARRHYRPGLLQ